MYIFFCKNCNKLVCKNNNDNSQKCSNCQSILLPLNKSVEEWNAMTSDEKNTLVDEACKDEKIGEELGAIGEAFSQAQTNQNGENPLTKSNNEKSDRDIATSPAFSNEKTVLDGGAKKAKSFKYLYFIATVFYILAAIMLYKGIDKMTNYENGEYSFSRHVNSYVGGDAYNFIINGTYSTSFFVLTTGFLITGVLFTGFGLILNEGSGRYRQTGFSSYS